MTLTSSILYWFAAGLAGHAIYLYKQTTDIAEAIVLGVFCTPLALMFGPAWILIAWFSPSFCLCPHCRLRTRTDASVCPHCTRRIVRRQKVKRIHSGRAAGPFVMRTENLPAAIDFGRDHS